MKIAYFAPCTYKDLKQRPQHIAELLSNSNEVFYIEPTISFIKYLIKGGDSYKGANYNINNNLHVIRLNGFLTFHKSIEAFDYFNINSMSERIQIRKIIKECDIIWLGYPGWYNVISKNKKKKIIFDKMDDDIEITTNIFLKIMLKRVESKLINKSEIIIVTCQEFYDRIKPQKKNVFIIRNGVPLEFKTTNSNYKIKTNNEKIFGYIGTVSHWFDMKAIEVILAQSAHNKVVIVGKNVIEELDHDRITYIDQVNKESLPNIIESFDICLYPFKKNKFLDTINPVKIYEYFSLNKPVIAVSSRETRIFGAGCNLYSNYDELKCLCSKELKEPFCNDIELASFINKNSWEERVISIERIINEKY